ncbi:MAG: DEAD/DEAH box helicase [Deltaproteobacteria bacterium]|nr:DEAD/DEAH box helicase [Deltaproteobacteria bacterium]
MPIDRQAKQKKKREEKKKAFRREQVRLQQRGKLDEYEWMAQSAFGSKDYAAALHLALECLKIKTSNLPMMRIAIQSAKFLNDQAVLYVLLSRLWKEKGPLAGDDYLFLGLSAFTRGEFELARDAYQLFLKMAQEQKWRLPKSHRMAAEKGLANSMLRIEREARSKPKQFPLFSDEQPKPVNPIKRMVERLIPASQEEPERILKSKPEPIKPKEPVIASSTTPQIEPVKVIRVDPEIKPKIHFSINQTAFLKALEAFQPGDSETLNLTLEAYQLSFRTSYDQLICLPTLKNIQSLWYQEETARKVMRDFRGRTILADEVGLGKTIEAGLILKEYILRGLVRSALILTPSSLVNQWQEELKEKFDLSFVCSNDLLFRHDPEGFWKEPFLLVSLQTARSKRHYEAVTRRTYDMVIVDEAHHLKNRATNNWKLVNSLLKTFILLLTATPVQNKLEELYNLVTLLKPGHLKTQKAFKEEFVTKGNPTDPRNREKLRQLLKEVMVRNTRSVTRLHLPPRFAWTIRVNPDNGEGSFYRHISDFIAGLVQKTANELPKMNLRKLLEAAGSSPPAAFRMLEKMVGEKDNDLGRQAEKLLELKKEVPVVSKTKKALELLKADSEQKIIFVNYLATLDHLHQILNKEKIPHLVFQGSLTPEQKKEVMAGFKGGCPILLTTGTGGEGHNLQFCHTMINYDLPWNPMQIEQRIGRIHRIGQEHEVRVYNLCTAGTLEDHILEVLDRKINMFELVIGEIDMILGRLEGEEEFSDLVYEIWVQHPEEAEKKKAFDTLAARLTQARTSYEKSKELDEKLFQEDFGV